MCWGGYCSLPTDSFYSVWPSSHLRGGLYQTALLEIIFCSCGFYSVGLDRGKKCPLSLAPHNLLGLLWTQDTLTQTLFFSPFLVIDIPTHAEAIFLLLLLGHPKCPSVLATNFAFTEALLTFPFLPQTFHSLSLTAWLSPHHLPNSVSCPNPIFTLSGRGLFLP